MASSTTELKYNMMSVPFDGISGDKGISLNEINFANPTYTLDAGTSDRVLFWKPTIQDYEQYFYYGYKGQETALPPHWRLIGAPKGQENYDLQHPEGIAPGTVFWYKSFTTKTAVEQSMTSSGAVATDPYQTFVVTHKVGVNTYYFISNPYPCDLDVTWDGGQVVWSTDATYTLDAGASDRIMIWNPEIQDYALYFFYGYKTQEAGLKPTWRLVGGTSTDVLTTIPAGTGFWYYSFQAKGSDVEQTIRFNSPLK